MRGRHTLHHMTDRPEAKPRRRLPGHPLPSGFESDPPLDVPPFELSDEDVREIDEMVESVDQARLRAAEGSRRAYVG